MHARISLGAPGVPTLAEDDGASDTDPAALAVPTLDARAAAPSGDQPLAAVIPLIHVFAEVGQAMRPAERIRLHPPQCSPPRVIALRI